MSLIGRVQRCNSNTSQTQDPVSMSNNKNKMEHTNPNANTFKKLHMSK